VILIYSLEAMKRALSSLKPVPDFIIVDGREKVPVPTPQLPLVGGDDRCLSVAAASIIAKVIRDSIMEKYHSFYPAYCFNKNMGYGSGAHIQAIKEKGLCEVHRKSYRISL
jgi:ribonuclease HII